MFILHSSSVSYVSSLAYADHLTSPPLHWAQSAWLGAGRYQVGQEDIFHVATPLRLPLYTKGDISYQLSTRFAVGLAGFKLITLSPPQELSTLSLAPGLQVAYRINPHWQLKPFIHGGMGFSFNDRVQSVFLLSTGLSSLYRWSLYGLKGSFGQRLLLAKYHEDTWKDESLAIISNGMDMKLPYTFSVITTPLDLNLFMIYTLFTPHLETRLKQLSWTLKFGFHVGKATPQKFVLRGGLYYVAGDERLRGVRLNLGFPF